MISGRLEKFEQFVQPGGSTSVVELELEFRWKTPQGIKKQTRTYENQVMADGADINDSAVAFGKALQHIYDKMLVDLNTITAE